MIKCRCDKCNICEECDYYKQYIKRRNTCRIAFKIIGNKSNIKSILNSMKNKFGMYDISVTYKSSEDDCVAYGYCKCQYTLHYNLENEYYWFEDDVAKYNLHVVMLSKKINGFCEDYECDNGNVVRSRGYYKKDII